MNEIKQPPKPVMKPRPMPPEPPEMQEYRDKKMREKEDKAPTTRSTMGEGKLKFRAGGYVTSADGCAVRGKTKGRMI